MTLIELARDGLELIQQVQPELKNAAEVTKSLGTLGGAAVYVLQKGRRLVTYLIGQRRPATSRGTIRQELPEVAPREDVAILVDINRRLLHDVARFLEEQQISANLVVITNDPDYQSEVHFLEPDEPDAWEEMVREFNNAVGSIKHNLGAARYHIFLSAPLPLAFGLGAAWGTVDEATVYHWQDGTYYPAMPISRRLRQ